MNSLVAALEKVGDQLAGISEEIFGSDAARSWSDLAVLEIMATAARVARGAEALIVEATTQALERSESPAISARMTTRFGCGSVGELIQRTTRLSKRSAVDVCRAAAVVARPIAPSSGERLPAEFPALRDALARTDVGIDGVVAVSGSLTSSPAGRAAILAADEELAAAACGEGADAAPPACAEELRALAAVWAMYLDQDGAEPRESRALRKRDLTLGVCREGIVPIRGNLLPEVAAQLQRIFDSLLNPKVGVAPSPMGPVFTTVAETDIDGPSLASADLRSRPQKQHDALATLLTTVASSGTLPALGGAAPTLVVSVRAEDMRRDVGFAHISGCDEPVSIASARHIACTGAVERVSFDEQGRIVSIDSSERVFNHHQRRAIVLRDGGCIIPGCHVRGDWCEIHHVEESARGGPTHTDNGVLVCWHHHRTLDSSGWKIRMVRGVPEVRGPYWWDARMLWRRVTTSPVRMRERVVRTT